LLLLSLLLLQRLLRLWLLLLLQRLLRLWLLLLLPQRGGVRRVDFLCP
jgi:hypothetical protein